MVKTVNVKAKIIPSNRGGSHRTGRLDPSVSVADIKAALGFSANIVDDPYKVKQSWGFTIGGEQFGIWDYKGARWSTYGDQDVLESLFPGKVLYDSF